MSDRKSSSIRPRYPLFWQAVYPQDRTELRIPMCRTCGNLFKVSSYEDISCPTMIDVPAPDREIEEAVAKIRRDPNSRDLPADEVIASELRTRMFKPTPCGSKDFTFDTSEGALEIPLVDGVLSEFDGDGVEPLNFRYLPTDGLLAFGLVDPFLRPPTFYMVNLITGNVEVGYVNSGVAMPIGVGIEFPTTDGRNVVPISTALGEYGRGGDLIHYKHCIQSLSEAVPPEKLEMMARLGMDPQAAHITDIVAGYKCHIPGWHCQVKIQVDCNTHIPFITTKASRSEE